jgi:uncharacterized membrane protein
MAHPGVGVGGRRVGGGGILTADMTDSLAVAAMCGVPVERIVEGDEVERALWLRVTERASELTVQLIKAQASYNAEAVSKLFRRG